MTPGRPASLRARATCSAASWVRLDGLGTRTGSNLILDVHETAQNSNTERPAETGPRAHRTASPHVELSVLLSHEHGSFTLDDVASTERQHCCQ